MAKQEKILSEEERSFAAKLIEKTRSVALRRMAARLGKYAAMHLPDCENELWLVLCIQVKRLMVHENPEAWVYKTASNVAINYFKQLTKEENATKELSLYEEYIPSGEMSLEERVVNDLLWDEWEKTDYRRSLLDRLSDSEKQLYRLHFINKLPASEIAPILHKTPEAVYTALSRLRKKLIADIHLFKERS